MDFDRIFAFNIRALSKVDINNTGTLE